MKVCGVAEELRGLCQVLLHRLIRSIAESDEAYELPSVMAGHRLTKDQEDYLEALSRLHRAIREQGGSRAEEENPRSRDSPVSLPGERNERCRLGTVTGGGPNSGNTHPARRTNPDGVAHSKNLKTVQAICRAFFLIGKSGATPLGQAGFGRSGIPRRLGR